ncbi:MAG: AAA family ATPase [Planctomycetes bacterium]|nr:AAA family ATPase [Planctomycetota bacterium]
MPPANPRTLDAPALRADLTRNLADVVAVPPTAVEPILCALVAGGHVLLEGIPGIGKTLLARTIAQSIAGEFRRIQFTNDVMPGDVTGSAVWRPDLGRFALVRGPLFANVVLADEINRTSPRTLSCLLEAMESGQVSIEGRTLELGRPFLVLATRNPVEFHGTFPVPEAALDRFLVRVELAYPEAVFELALYGGRDCEARLREVRPVVDCEQLVALRAQVDEVAVRPAIAEYVYRVVQATRVHPDVQLGASPRAALAWLRAAKGRATFDGRDYVLPDDLKALALPALAHRVFRRDGAAAAPLLAEILQATEVPL